MSVLIILAVSQRQAKSDELMPAIDRYDGIFFRVLKKYLREGVLRNADVLIITKHQGIITSKQLVPYDPNFMERIASGNIDETRRKNIATLHEWLSRHRYSEIYVNCGRDFLRLIEGFEKLTSARITWAKGSLGQKAEHMKTWILRSSS